MSINSQDGTERDVPAPVDAAHVRLGDRVRFNDARTPLDPPSYVVAVVKRWEMFTDADDELVVRLGLECENGLPYGVFVVSVDCPIQVVG